MDPVLTDFSIFHWHACPSAMNELHVERAVRVFLWIQKKFMAVILTVMAEPGTKEAEDELLNYKRTHTWLPDEADVSGVDPFTIPPDPFPLFIPISIPGTSNQPTDSPQLPAVLDSNPGQVSESRPPPPSGVLYPVPAIGFLPFSEGNNQPSSSGSVSLTNLFAPSRERASQAGHTPDSGGKDHAPKKSAKFATFRTAYYLPDRPDRPAVSFVPFCRPGSVAPADPGPSQSNAVCPASVIAHDHIAPIQRDDLPQSSGDNYIPLAPADQIPVPGQPQREENPHDYTIGIMDGTDRHIICPADEERRFLEAREREDRWNEDGGEGEETIGNEEEDFRDVSIEEDQPPVYPDQGLDVVEDEPPELPGEGTEEHYSQDPLVIAADSIPILEGEDTPETVKAKLRALMGRNVEAHGFCLNEEVHDRSRVPIQWSQGFFHVSLLRSAGTGPSRSSQTFKCPHQGCDAFIKFISRSCKSAWE
jgi:hypothetical protein